VPVHYLEIQQLHPCICALQRATTLLDFEPLARERLANMALAYIVGGAGSEVALTSNREAWDRIKLRSRVLVDASRIDTHVLLFGRELPHPMLSWHRLCTAAMIHTADELGTVRGAGKAG